MRGFGGLFKAINLVRGDSDQVQGDGAGGAFEQELRGVYASARSVIPSFLSLDRAEHVDGELLIVMELADCSLHDLLVKYQAAGRRRCRAELLGYFAEAADALDVNQERRSQHLDVKPQPLLIGRHVKVATWTRSSPPVLSGAAPHAVQMVCHAGVRRRRAFLGNITSVQRSI